jgi:lipopolysaccharide/colanic/teichoic acid biosynthesis glycosyltransferase
MLTANKAGRLAQPVSPSDIAAICVDVAIRPNGYFRWREGFDRLVAAILLVPAMPLIGLLVGLVRLNSRGPGIYCQSRVGKNGRLFTMYKIRTMRVDAESRSGPVWTQAADPRVTRLGSLLRKLHLDELPQLFNVVRGDMALIGPRPERPEFVHLLAAEIHGYTGRLVVRPGITGLAQINLPPDATLDDVRRKLVLDLEYVRAAGPMLDSRILFCTLLHALGLPGVWGSRICGLHREVSIA